MGMQMGMCMWTDYKSHGEDLTSSAAAIVNIRFISFLFGSGFIFSFYVRYTGFSIHQCRISPIPCRLLFLPVIGKREEEGLGWDGMGGAR